MAQTYRILVDTPVQMNIFTDNERKILQNLLDVDDFGYLFQGSVKPIHETFTMDSETVNDIIENETVNNALGLVLLDAMDNMRDTYGNLNEEDVFDVEINSERAFRQLMRNAVSRMPDNQDISLKIITDFGAPSNNLGMRPFSMNSIVFKKSGVYSSSMDFMGPGQDDKLVSSVSRTSNVKPVASVEDVAPVAEPEYTITDYIMPASAVIPQLRNIDGPIGRYVREFGNQFVEALASGTQLNTGAENGKNSYNYMNIFLVDNENRFFNVMKDGAPVAGGLLRSVDEAEVLDTLKKAEPVGYAVPTLDVLKNRIGEYQFDNLKQKLAHIQNEIIQFGVENVTFDFAKFKENDRNYVYAELSETPAIRMVSQPIADVIRMDMMQLAKLIQTEMTSQGLASNDDFVAAKIVISKNANFAVKNSKGYHIMDYNFSEPNQELALEF